MGKKAVLVGCNYPGTKAELRGCVNDVKNMQQCLVNRYGFEEEDINILIDTDESYTQPTGANIRRAMADLIASAEPGDFLFLHYSGHGTRLPAETGDQDDTGYDECIVPCDMNLITDDDFRKFVDHIPQGCKITIVSDSCHSGGLIDKTKEQIGDSTKSEEDADSGGFSFRGFIKKKVESALESYGESDSVPEESRGIKSRSLPLSTLIEILKQKTGNDDIEVGKLRTTLFDIFGDDASPKVKQFMKVVMEKLQGQDDTDGGGFDDLLWSMATLGFEDYIEPLKVYLQKYREMEGDSKGSSKRDAGNSGGSTAQVVPQTTSFINSQAALDAQHASLSRTQAAVNAQQASLSRTQASMVAAQQASLSRPQQQQGQQREHSHLMIPVQLGVPSSSNGINQ